MTRPLMTRADLLEELEEIEVERARIVEQRDVVNPDGRANRLAGLDEWERVTREDLARIEEAT